MDPLRAKPDLGRVLKEHVDVHSLGTEIVLAGKKVANVHSLDLTDGVEIMKLIVEEPIQTPVETVGECKNQVLLDCSRDTGLVGVQASRRRSMLSSLGTEVLNWAFWSECVIDALLGEVSHIFRVVIRMAVSGGI